MIGIGINNRSNSIDRTCIPPGSSHNYPHKPSHHPCMGHSLVQGIPGIGLAHNQHTEHRIYCRAHCNRFYHQFVFLVLLPSSVTVGN